MSIQSNFPAIAPTLNLSFALTKALDPRISFSRASTATYYGTQTAKAEENLLLRSQEFDVNWSVAALTVTANSTSAPDGTITADTLQFEDASTSRIFAAFTVSTGSTCVASFHAKYIDKQWIALRLNDTASIRYVWLDVLNGVVGTNQTNLSATVTAVANGYFRFVVTLTNAGASNTFSLHGVNGDNSTSNAGQTGSVFIWGAQVEQRSAVTAYTPTTTQPITNYIPVLQTAASGVARFDHNPTTFESLGLLIEEQRTNLTNYSEQFDNAVWTKADVVIGVNAAVAPDGTLSADTFIPNTTNTVHAITRVSLTVGTQYTLSIYAKAAGYQFLAVSNAGATALTSIFNLANGTVSNGASITSSITPVGNGWYRCSVVFTAGFVALAFYGSTSATVINTFAGNGFSGIYIWGASLEQGAFSTSYIPTVASQVTRAADAASMTGANFSSWYNQAAGSYMFDGVFRGPISSFPLVAYASDGTTSNRMSFGFYDFNNFGVVVNGVSTAGIAAGTPVQGQNVKLAAAYATNNFAASLNGLASVADADGVLPVISQIRFGATVSGNQNLNGTISKIAYYPIRCTNAQLQGLTS
jgi:hypothetical protein